MGPGTGPPLTSQRCSLLKWTTSPLNATDPEALAAPLSDLRELRDGATLIVRSQHAAAMATAAAAIPSSTGVEDAVLAAGAKAAPRAGAGTKKPVAVTVAAPARRER